MLGDVRFQKSILLSVGDDPSGHNPSGQDPQKNSDGSPLPVTGYGFPIQAQYVLMPGSSASPVLLFPYVIRSEINVR